MWGFLSKISSTLRDSEQSSSRNSSLPVTINDDLERGVHASSPPPLQPPPEDEPEEEVDPLTVDLSELPFFVPHIEELFATKNGDRVSVYRIRNYILTDLANVGTATRDRPIAYDMSISNLDVPLAPEDANSALFFVNPTDYHVAAWLAAFKTSQTSSFRLAMALMAIHRNFENHSPNPFDFSGTQVDPEDIDMLEQLLRTQLDSDAAAAVAAAEAAAPTIEVHKKFDDVLPTSSSSSLMIDSAPTVLHIETRSPVMRLILENIRVFARLLIDGGSEFVYVTELEAKFFFFWAASGHYLHSRVKLSRQQLDEALKEVEKARTGIQTVSSMLARGDRLAID